MSENQTPAWLKDLPKTVDEAWGRLQRFLDHLPNDIERQKAIRVLRRRLAHPEVAPGSVAYNQADLERVNSATRHYNPPINSSPPCVCGAPRGKHDPMTGEYPPNGCQGFFAEPV